MCDKKYCEKKIRKKYENHNVFKLIMEEGEDSPYSTSFMVRILFIPVAFKNYALPLSGIAFGPYFAVAVPFIIFFACLFCFIGIQLKDPQKLVNIRGFDKKTSGEKFNMIFTYFILVLSVFLICFVGFRSRKKLKELEKRETEKVSFFS